MRRDNEKMERTIEHWICCQRLCHQIFRQSFWMRNLNEDEFIGVSDLDIRLE